MMIFECIYNESYTNNKSIESFASCYTRGLGDVERFLLSVRLRGVILLAYLTVHFHHLQPFLSLNIFLSMSLIRVYRLSLPFLRDEALIEFSFAPC